MPPKVWGQNQWQQKDFVNCMCVSETRSAPNRKPANNQASAEYHIYQFWGRHSHTQIIDWWHHKQRPWPPIIHCGSMPSKYSIATWIHCGSMRKNSNWDDIATSHTQWIYVSHIIDSPSQLGQRDDIQGLQSRRPKYESNHVITCVEVKHGRNHLIISH